MINIKKQIDIEDLHIMDILDFSVHSEIFKELQNPIVSRIRINIADYFDPPEFIPDMSLADDLPGDFDISDMFIICAKNK